MAGTTIEADNYLTALSVCLGIFILSISLIEWGAANGAKAEALHRNAEDLTAFQLKIGQLLAQLETDEGNDKDDFNRLREEYGSIKDRCGANHTPVDDLRFRAAKRAAKEFQQKTGNPEMNSLGAFWAIFIWYMSSIWYFLIFWLIIASALIGAFWIPSID